MFQVVISTPARPSGSCVQSYSVVTEEATTITEAMRLGYLAVNSDEIIYHEMISWMREGGDRAIFLDTLTWSVESDSEEVPVIPGMTCGMGIDTLHDGYMAWRAIDHVLSPKMGKNPTVDALVTSFVEEAVGEDLAPEVWAMYT